MTTTASLPTAVEQLLGKKDLSVEISRRGTLFKIEREGDPRFPEVSRFIVSFRQAPSRGETDYIRRVLSANQFKILSFFTLENLHIVTVSHKPDKPVRKKRV